jgi:glutaredoxin 3
MPKVEIYTKATCPYCIRALELLDKKKVKYHQIEVGNDPEKRAALKEKSNGRHTVPQIFINDKGIGGCDDLFALEESGKLDAMLKG